MIIFSAIVFQLSDWKMAPFLRNLCYDRLDCIDDCNLSQNRQFFFSNFLAKIFSKSQHRSLDDKHRFPECGFIKILIFTNFFSNVANCFLWTNGRDVTPWTSQTFRSSTFFVSRAELIRIKRRMKGSRVRSPNPGKKWAKVVIHTYVHMYMGAFNKGQCSVLCSQILPKNATHTLNISSFCNDKNNSTMVF
jgi:hypothetical protein